MLQLLRLTALVSIVYVALGAVGKTPSNVAMGDTPSNSCIADTTGLQRAIDAVDYAEAVLVGNGEIYQGWSVEQIKAEVAALPRYDDSDGISSEELLALELLLELGRQLAYAKATDALERQLDATPEGIRIASAEGGINFETLEALRGSC